MHIDRATHQELNRASFRLQVRFSGAQLEALRALAASSGRSLSGSLRWLLQERLAEGRPAASDAARESSLLALAGLVASEQTLRLLESMLPGGSQRSAALRPAAAGDAERRLRELEAGGPADG
jgi:hypothetical protein